MSAVTSVSVAASAAADADAVDDDAGRDQAHSVDVMQRDAQHSAREHRHATDRSSLSRWMKRLLLLLLLKGRG